MLSETDARRLHRKNAKALWLIIESSERDAMVVAAKAKAAWHVKEQERLLGV